MINRSLLLLAFLLFFLTTTGGCQEAGNAVRMVAGSTWHQKYNWQAEDYFKAPDVIALCEAIEDDNIAEIERLVKAGADVNAIGKDNMTPLLWAYPDNKLERFTKLLELGADPNVIVNSRFATRGIRPGDSVMTMSAKTSFKGYLKAVLDHGGDPNLKTISGKETPLHIVIFRGGDQKKIKMLIDAGADINCADGKTYTPVIEALSCGSQFDTALYLLEKGADPSIHEKYGLRNFVEFLVSQEIRKKESWSQQQKEDFIRIEKWLVEHGWDVDATRVDYKRWKAWRDKKGPVTIHFKEALGYRERAARIEAKKQAEASDKKDLESGKATDNSKAVK